MRAIKARLSKFSTVDEYVHGWGHYYYGSGILLPTRKAEPAGTDVSLHIEIATGETVLRGEGVVEEVRANSEGQPVGMVIRFTRLDATSKRLIAEILDHKKATRTSASHTVPEESAPKEDTSDVPAISAIADAFDQTFDSIFGGTASGTPTAEPTDAAAPAAPEPDDASGPKLPGGPVDAGADPADAAPADQTVAGIPGLDDTPREQALGRLALKSAVASRVKPGDDSEAGTSTGGHLVPPGVDSDALDAAFADEPEDLLASEVDPSGGDEPAEDPEDTLSSSFRAAAEAAAAASAEGEIALDALAGESNNEVTTLAPADEKKGVFARFFSWLAGLFGGGK